jgi:hypothetical protein
MTNPQPQLTSRLKRIQSSLGVEADGLLGPETLTALERKLGIVAATRAVHLECSRRSLDLLLGFEVGSRQRYEKEFQRPVWPGGNSGVTVGIGYDVGMTQRAQVRADWGVAQVKIPLAVAEEVFYTRTLPSFAELTRKTFPGVQRLPADAQGMLLSLVYNRGASIDGPRRVEMANIQKLLRASKHSLPAVAAEFESMKRLWPDLPGLQIRRQREAEVIRASRRRYEAGEIVKI